MPFRRASHSGTADVARMLYNFNEALNKYDSSLSQLMSLGFWGFVVVGRSEERRVGKECRIG